MARPRAFDEERLLTGVMHAFRRKGYAATTVRDLEEAAGFTSGSLYNSYGDKQGLFAAASAHYLRTVVDRRLQTHAPAGSGIEGLRSLFLSLLDEPGGTTDGCLITNSAVEFSGEAPALVSEGFARLGATFADRLREAFGIVRKEEAMALLALYQGILVLVRSGADPAPLEATIRDQFDKLERLHDA